MENGLCVKRALYYPRKNTLWVTAVWFVCNVPDQSVALFDTKENNTIFHYEIFLGWQQYYYVTMFVFLLAFILQELFIQSHQHDWID